MAWDVHDDNIIVMCFRPRIVKTLLRGLPIFRSPLQHASHKYYKLFLPFSFEAVFRRLQAYILR
jgi:hypothetical protein